MMSTKRKLTNDKDDVEVEMLEGIAGAYPGLFVDKELGIVMLNRERKYRVGIISGGGSGHEPFPAGLVGEGMLTASVGGKVFTAPPIASILAAIINVAKLNKGGILLLIMNYTGDVLNFAVAMEEARTKGYNVECLIVSDDVSQYAIDIKGITGRRGMVGVVFMAKILGGFSKDGKSLSELIAIGRCINYRLGTLGVCLHPCTLPGSIETMFEIEENHVEFGMGVHGEAGTATIEVTSLKELVNQMLVKIMSCLALEENDQVVALVNNLGSLSAMEMLIISREVRAQLEDVKVVVMRNYQGSVMTSIDMRGFQICLLNITGNTDWLTYLDDETEAFAWPGKRISHVIEKFPQRLDKLEVDNEVPMLEGMMLNEKYSDLFRKCLLEISRTLMDECATLNRLDTEVGDGDCGTTLRRYAEGIVQEMFKLPTSNVASTLAMLSKLAETLMGGTSGALYSLMLMAAAKDCQNWETCWMAAIEVVQKYSRAKLGDRTMLDALIPACKGFVLHLKNNGDHSWPIALKVALQRAEEGCEATRTMFARAGRASYVDPSKIKDVDAGAYAIVLVLKTLVKTLKRKEENVQCPL